MDDHTLTNKAVHSAAFILHKHFTGKKYNYLFLYNLIILLSYWVEEVIKETDRQRQATAPLSSPLMTGQWTPAGRLRQKISEITL